MRLSILSVLLLVLGGTVQAQPPAGYYDAAQGLSGEPLRTALYQIIGAHTTIAYGNLWSVFQAVDRKPTNKVWDMYSDVPGGTPAYEYVFVTDQCSGSPSSEAVCFNREHSFPVSWFNDVPPMNSDAFHIYPTDAWVNQKRASWPYGRVTSPTWTSTNGSKLGPCSWPGCSGTVFEPIDAYKGDFARSFFYMLTAYLPNLGTWPCPMMTAANFSPWAESLLLGWNELDPVSQKEVDRNNSLYILQGNRNPYIDNPQWANSVWDPFAGVEEVQQSIGSVWYAEDGLQILLEQPVQGAALLVLDMTGREVLATRLSDQRSTVDLNVTAGMYVAVLSTATQRTVVRFVR